MVAGIQVCKLILTAMEAIGGTVTYTHLNGRLDSDFVGGVEWGSMSTVNKGK